MKINEFLRVALTCILGLVWGGWVAGQWTFAMELAAPPPTESLGGPVNYWASVGLCCASQRVSLSTPSSMSATLLLRSFCGNAYLTPPC
jgi:hypothetical protein